MCSSHTAMISGAWINILMAWEARDW
jgi:hypothetical protein